MISISMYPGSEQGRPRAAATLFIGAFHGETMRYLDTWLRVRHECPFCDFSARYPEAEGTLWLSVLVDLFQVQIPVYYDVDKVIDSAWEMLMYTEEFHDEESALFLLTHPFIEEIDSVVALASENDCMLIPPVTFRSLVCPFPRPFLCRRMAAPPRVHPSLIRPSSGIADSGPVTSDGIREKSGVEPGRGRPL